MSPIDMCDVCLYVCAYVKLHVIRILFWFTHFCPQELQVDLFVTELTWRKQ